MLTITGIAQQRERLVRMGRQDHLVEALCLTTTRLDQHVIRVARDGIDRRAQPQPTGERPDQRLHVPSGAPTDRPPGRPTPERQHAVIVEELHQETCGKTPHLARRGRPHRRRLRHDQPLDERPRETMTLQPVSKRDVLGTIAKQLSSGTVEPSEIGDHPVKPRGQEMRALCEQATRRRTAVLEIPHPIADAETHRRPLPADTQPLEQPLEVRIVAVIEHNEPGVDLMRLVRRVDADRIRVPARIAIRLKHGDVMRPLEQMGHHQPRDAGTNHSNPHLSDHLSSRRARPTLAEQAQRGRSVPVRSGSATPVRGTQRAEQGGAVRAASRWRVDAEG